MSRATQQIQWMYASLSEIGFPQPQPAVIYADNNGAIALAKTMKGTTHVKHIDVRHHYIRELVGGGQVGFAYIPSDENLADLLTKPLPRLAHHNLCLALRLCEE